MKKWYILKVLSGSEDKISNKIIINYKNFKLDEYFDKILVPKEEIIEIKNGKKKNSNRKFFPGYILIKMEVNEKTINIINNIKNIFGFIKNGNTLSSIDDEEVDKIFKKVEKSINDPKPKIIFNIGEKIRVIDGPFSDFNGLVEKVDYLKNKITVLISIFGRFTPIDLNFKQIEKIL